MITLQSYVCGRWHGGSGKPRPLYNPATGEVLAECNADGIDFAAVVAHGRDVGSPALLELGFGPFVGPLVERVPPVRRTFTPASSAC